MNEVKIPEGYKQTEVGVIPKDWDVKNFGELFESSIPRKTIKPSNLVTFVGMQDVTENAQLAHQTIISYERVKSGFTYFEKGDVLLAKITPCFENGKGCHTKSLKTKYGFGSTEFHVLRANSASDSKFIYFWTTHSRFRVDLESAMVGSAGHRRVPFSEVRSYQIPCPTSKSEQTAIATALSDVDNLIQSLEKLIAKKEAIKTGTMQQLLTGKTRLPEFATREDSSPKGFKQTELGQIPEDWELIKLGNYFDFKNGLNKAKEFFGYGTPIVNYMDVYKSGSINSTSIKGKVSVTTDEQINYSAKKGDVFFTRTSETVEEIGLSSVLESDIDKAVFSGFVLRARQKKEVLKPSFMKYCFRTSSSRKQIQGTASYTTRALTNGKLLSQILVPKPTKPEQTAIATILSNMDAEIQVLQQRLDKTRNIKQGMMQQLLTGKVRLAH